MIKRLNDQFFWLLILTTVTVVLIYSNFLNHPFIYDDVAQIYNNSKLHDITKLKDIIFCNIRQTRILQNVSFAIDWWIGSGNPSAFRVTNLILHLLNGFLLFKLIYSLLNDKTLTYLATSFFLVHPMQIQSVHYIMGRLSLLETLFILLVLLVNINFVKNKKIWTIILLTMSLFVKESCVLLPCYIILSDFFILKIPWRKLPSLQYLLYFSLYLLFIPLFHYIDPEHKGHYLVTGFDLFPMIDYVIFQFHDLFFYFQLLFNPLNQSIIHGISQLGTETYIQASLGVVVFFVFLIIALANIKKRPMISFLVTISYISIFPYLNFIMQLINPFAEYRYYFFTALMLIFLSMILRLVLKKESLLMVVSLMFIIYWGSFLVLNIKSFRQRELAFSHSHTLYPNDPRLNIILVASYLKGNQLHLALNYLEQANKQLEIYPYPTVMNYYLTISYVDVLSKLGNLDQALVALGKIDLNTVHKSFYCHFLKTKFYLLYDLKHQDELSELIKNHERLKAERKCQVNFNEKPLPSNLILE